jgi:hypothetical protein
VPDEWVEELVGAELPDALAVALGAVMTSFLPAEPARRETLRLGSTSLVSKQFLI